ncbi:hypothetical protein Y032_0555g3378 [Ancylostoma ceylanicum]|nr:hypothetical protein Y032_0555g3378 [Ancylostoma ceylanicum]
MGLRMNGAATTLYCIQLLSASVHATPVHVVGFPELDYNGHRRRIWPMPVYVFVSSHHGGFPDFRPQQLALATMT